MASAAVAAAIALAGCQTDGVSIPERALKPLSHEMVSDLERKNMPKESPLLVRLFKQEAELEVWKQDSGGRFALLKTYPICRWSGELGPKVKEGDRQAPEGFYTITPGQMNPNSNYYLSVNIGFPNEFDRAHGRTGAFLMIHGDCSSRGCYAMTDEQIAEIYALARESFFGGQRSFQVQAYPFRMTPINMARHRNNPNMPFWKMLKQGYDHFEVTRLEPKVDVCEKRYVFDAEPPAAASAHGVPASFKFNAAARCPAYQVPQEIADEVAAKTRRDEVETAALVQKGTPAAPVRTGTDGGMHPVFLAALKPQVVRDHDGNVRTIIDAPRAPGTIPATVNPPRDPNAPSDPVTAVAAAPAGGKPAPQTQTAAAKPNAASDSGNMFTRLFTSQGDTAPKTTNGQSESGLDRVTGSVSRLFGIGEDKKPASPPRQAAVPPPKPVQLTRPKPAPAPPAAAYQAEPKAAAAQPAAPPPADQSTRTTAAGDSGLLSSQPMAPPGTFDSRWGSWR